MNAHMSWDFTYVLGIAAFLVLWLLVSSPSTETRLKNHIQRMGGKLYEKRWVPFAGGSRDTKVYDIVYLDSGARVHHARAIVSLFREVSLLNDRVVYPPEEAEPSRSPGTGNACPDRDLRN